MFFPRCKGTRLHIYTEIWQSDCLCTLIFYVLENRKIKVTGYALITWNFILNCTFIRYIPVRAKIRTSDETDQQVNNFKYVGYIGFGHQNGFDLKLANFQCLCWTIRRTRTESVLNFSVMAVPMLFYGAECWALTINERKRIALPETRFLGPVAGHRRSGGIQNKDIRD
jgi:hypothetical protein